MPSPLLLAPFHMFLFIEDAPIHFFLLLIISIILFSVKSCIFTPPKITKQRCNAALRRVSYRENYRHAGIVSSLRMVSVQTRCCGPSVIVIVAQIKKVVNKKSTAFYVMRCVFCYVVAGGSGVGSLFSNTFTLSSSSCR